MTYDPLDGAAITFNIDASSGRTYRLPLQVAGRLDLFPEYEAAYYADITTPSPPVLAHT